jgi:hypothetical protein
MLAGKPHEKRQLGEPGFVRCENGTTDNKVLKFLLDFTGLRSNTKMIFLSVMKFRVQIS